jgi:hypothetical protein
MSRKTTIELASSGRPYGRQAMWEAMRKQRRFTRADLDHLNVERDTVRSYLRSLVKAGYVVVAVQQGHHSPAVYELTNDVGLEAPRLRRDGSPVEQGQVREHMWRTMKMLPSFTFLDVAVTASTEEVRVTEQDAKDYVKHLVRAKYLAVLKPATKRNKAVYRLARNTGPKPPMVTRAKIVFDPNLGKVAWIEEVDA